MKKSFIGITIVMTLNDVSVPFSQANFKLCPKDMP